MRSLGAVFRRLGGWLYRCGCRLEVGARAQKNPFPLAPPPVLFVYDERPTMELPVVGAEEVH